MKQKIKFAKVIRKGSKQFVKIWMMMKPKSNYIKVIRKENTVGENKKESTDRAFDKVKNCCMMDPSILKSKAFKIIQEEYLSGIRKGPDFICSIQHKCKY